MISEVIAASVGGITVFLTTFYFYLNLFIILSITTMISQAIATAATVGGIALIWTYFTLKTFRICKQIVLPPPEKIRTERCEYCGEIFPYFEGKRKSTGMQYIYVCKHCAHIESMDDA